MSSNSNPWPSPVPTAFTQGRIVPWRALEGYSPRAEEERVSLLAMHLIKPLQHLGTTQHHVFGPGLIHLNGNLLAVTLRLQVGARQMYWLAHPYDPELWQLFDEWNGRGRCAFLLVDDRTAAVTALDYRGFDRDLRARIRSCTTVAIEHFADVAHYLAASGEIAQSATSDIPDIPELEYIEVCMFTTTALQSMQPRNAMASPSTWRH